MQGVKEQEHLESSLSNERKVFVLLTRFPDNGSKTIGFITNYYYTHASIGLEEDMDTFYSFVCKGFFIEKITKYVKPSREPFPCELYEMTVTKEKYCAIKNILKEFSDNKRSYRYAKLGVFFGLLHIPFVRKDYYFCSHFVAEVLKRSKTICTNKNSALFFPRDFRTLSGLSLIFKGNLQGYLTKFAIPSVIA